MLPMPSARASAWRIAELTGIDPWFLAQIEDLVESEETMCGVRLESLQTDDVRT